MPAGTLEARAAQGDIEALLELGRRCESEDKSAAARAWFARAAKAGSIAGLRLLGLNLLTKEPIEAEHGVNMVRAAADKGDADAARICAVLAAGDAALPDRWKVAQRCLEIARDRGSEFAREQLEFLERTKPDFGAPSSTARAIFSAPRISVIEGFATKDECAWLIERARPGLRRASVYDPASGGAMTEDARSNSAVEFGLAELDLVVTHVRARIAAVTKISQLETSSVLQYAPGQEFRPHFDFLDASQPGYAADLVKRGQRVATFLIYLNEDFEGGETEFPNLDWRFKGRAGDALLFWNVDESGAPDTLALHAGLPPTRGEKWLFSQWLRQGPKL
jgi:hypothetical protein